MFVAEVHYLVFLTTYLLAKIGDRLSQNAVLRSNRFQNCGDIIGSMFVDTRSILSFRELISCCNIAAQAGMVLSGAATDADLVVTAGFESCC